MGLIKAAVGAIGSTLGDQWLDAIQCNNLDNDTLMVRVTSSTEQISKGSRIIVNPGQIALIVDTGKVLDATAEPGAYTFDESTSPSFFGGQFGAVFKEMWERFKYNGTPARGQAVYFFNAKEIIDNKFGSPAPIPYKDWGHPNFNPRTNSLYAMAVEIKVYGTYTFRITNPFAFMNNVAGTASVYKRADLSEQIRSEFIGVFRNTLTELGSDEYKVEALDLPHKDDEIVAAMKEKNYDVQIKERGLEIVSIAVTSIKFTEDSDKKIREYELSDAYTQSGYMAGAAGRAMETAAANNAGAMTGFMGFGMASNSAGSMGVNPSAAMAAQQAQIEKMQQAQAEQAAQAAAAATAAAQAQAQAADNSWTCSCGNVNTGKFCSECGSTKPEAPAASDSWTCSCGNVSAGKFCSNCGTKKPEVPAAPTCGKCGYTADEPFKFCPECGERQ